MDDVIQAMMAGTLVPDSEEEEEGAPAATAAPAPRKRSTPGAASTKLEDAVQEAAASAGKTMQAAVSEIESRTVKAGAKKTKVRRMASGDVSEALAATKAASVSRDRADMPQMDGPHALDDWTNRFSYTESHTMPMEMKRKSLAEALRESMPIDDVLEASAEVAAAAASSGGAEAASTPPPKMPTVEEFFGDELVVPLAGYAKDMHEMMQQIVAEIEHRASLSEAAVRDAATFKAREKADIKRERKREARNIRQNRTSKPKKKPGEKSEAALEAEVAEAAAAEEVKPDPDMLANASTTHMTIEALEPCSRAYCADFFRASRGVEFGERPCRKGKKCVFVLLAARYPDTAVESANKEGFVCREFLLPSELDDWRESGIMPPAPKLCLGCERMVTTAYFHIYQQRGEAPPELLQTHYNPVDEPGEYSADHCLFPDPDQSKWTGIVRPFVKFEPNSFVSVPFEITAKPIPPATEGRKWKLLGAQEVMAGFRLSPSSFYMRAAQQAQADFVASQPDEDEAAAAMAKTSKPGGSSSASAAAAAASADTNTVSCEVGGTLAAGAITLDRDCRGAWVCGPPNAVMRGVRPCRPLRSREWIAAEEEACPPLPGFGSMQEMVPRTVLASAFPQFAANVFCTFGEALENVQADPPSHFLVLTPTVTKAVEMFSFPRDVLDALTLDMETLTREDDIQFKKYYRVLLTVLYRLQWAHCLRGHGEDRRYDYWLQIFADTHIDLCIAMHEAGHFDDVSLKNPDLNPNSVHQSILDMHFPHDARVTHAGDLPDLTSCIQFAGVWFHLRQRIKTKGKAKTKTKPKSARGSSGAAPRRGSKTRVESVVEALVHLIAGKTQAHKCQVRNFATIAGRYMIQFPQVGTLFRAIITISLLGNYPHAQAHPPFASRLHMVYAMRPEVMSDRELFLWMADNEQMSFGIVKEYYRYLVSHMPSFEMVLEETTHWCTVRDYICDSMDRARNVLGMAASSGGDSFNGFAFATQRQGYAGHGPISTKFGADLTCSINNGIFLEAMRTVDTDMHLMHEVHELPLITKLRKGTFSEVFVHETERFFTRRLLNDNVVRPQSSVTHLAKIVGQEETEAILGAMRYAVHNRVPRSSTREPVETCWLAHFGMSHEGITALRALYYDYETKDIADNSLTSRVTALFAYSPQDFHIAAIYFQVIAEWRSAAGFHLPACFIRTQTEALRAKTFTAPWDPLPEGTGVFHYCPSCQRWLADVVDIDDPETRNSMYSVGFKNALYSHDTKRIYCGHTRVQNTSRKEVESGQYSNMDAVLEDLHEARSVRLYLSTPVCNITPAVPVNMIGRVQRLGGRLWALCECCASLTQWDGTMHGPNGFTCGFHDPEAPRLLTAHQEEAQRLRDLRTHIPPKDACDYCHLVLRPGDKFAKIIALDDNGDILGDDQDKDGNYTNRGAPTWKYMNYVMCSIDGRSLFYRAFRAGPSGTPVTVTRRSILEKHIHQARERHFYLQTNSRIAPRSSASGGGGDS